MPGEFVSWSPNVTGYLSFALIGQTDYPDVLHPKGDRLIEGRIFAFQRRFMSDSTIPFLRPLKAFYFTRHQYVKLVDIWDRKVAALWSDAHQLRRDKVFWFALSGEIDQSADAVVGQILIFRRRIVSVQGMNIAETEAVVADFHRERPLDAEDKLDSKKFRSDIEAEHQLICVASVQLKLARDGLVQLTPDVFVSSIDETQKLTETERFARLAYFFVRDLTHSHYHHAKTTDSVLSVWPSEESGWLLGRCDASASKLRVAGQRSRSRPRGRTGRADGPGRQNRGLGSGPRRRCWCTG